MVTHKPQQQSADPHFAKAFNLCFRDRKPIGSLPEMLRFLYSEGLSNKPLSTVPKNDKAVPLKDKIENNAVLWVLGTMLGGFLAGIGTYKAVIEIAKLEVVSAAVLEGKGSRISDLESENAVLRNEKLALTTERNKLASDKGTLEQKPMGLTHQDWFSFTPPNFPADWAGTRFRLVFRVDGNYYTYPTGRALWKATGTPITPQEMPLPAFRNEHDIDCELFVAKDEDGVEFVASSTRLVRLKPRDEEPEQKGEIELMFSFPTTDSGSRGDTRGSALSPTRGAARGIDIGRSTRGGAVRGMQTEDMPVKELGKPMWHPSGAIRIEMRVLRRAIVP